MIFVLLLISVTEFTHPTFFACSYNTVSCCNWGQGSYQLSFGDDVIKTGGSFGLSEATTFATPSDDNPASTTDPASNQVPCDGMNEKRCGKNAACVWDGDVCIDV